MTEALNGIASLVPLPLRAKEVHPSDLSSLDKSPDSKEQTQILAGTPNPGKYRKSSQPDNRVYWVFEDKFAGTNQWQIFEVFAASVHRWRPQAVKERSTLGT